MVEERLLSYGKHLTRDIGFREPTEVISYIIMLKGE
jgi:hypothetical protein